MAWKPNIPNIESNIFLSENNFRTFKIGCLGVMKDKLKIPLNRIRLRIMPTALFVGFAFGKHRDPLPIENEIVAIHKKNKTCSSVCKLKNYCRMRLGININ